ncbi:hypothetical protein V1477_009428 [Vespula maculifrons]|uniref:Uncharacterized protein n=1 Tax=Vespula maculifrons TaxID=7453 RepID=A0ABD2CA03_VESMC
MPSQKNPNTPRRIKMKSIHNSLDRFLIEHQINIRLQNRENNFQAKSMHWNVLDNTFSQNIVIKINCYNKAFIHYSKTF